MSESKAIVLVKGGRVKLEKDDKPIKNVRITLSWDKNKFDSGGKYDLDITAFALKWVNGDSSNSKCLSDKWITYYHQPASPNNAITHSGDNQDGEGDKDEVLDVKLPALPPETDEVSIVTTIYDAEIKKQNFGMVNNAVVTITNADDDTTIATYHLEDDFSTETAVQLGSLVKKNGGWSFKAVGQGYKIGLGEFVTGYGLTVA